MTPVSDGGYQMTRGFSPILKNVRAFADERNATAVATQSESLRDVRNVFAKMEIEGQEEMHLSNEASGKGKDIRA